MKPWPFLLAALVMANQLFALPDTHAIAGGIWRIDLPASATKPAVRFNDKAVKTVRSNNGWHAVIGIPLDASGDIQASVDGKALTLALTEHAYAEQRLTVQRKHSNPNNTAMERIRSEFARMSPVYTSFNNNTTEHWPEFRWPLHGRVSSPFGLRRFFNDQPRRPHSGIDIAAPTGTAVKAPATGTVVLTGDFYFNGNSVFIDHGQGLISMMCHLSRIDVKEGDVVEIGTTIGAVGATGRATGPHLHWTVSLNNARIDPRLVVPEPLKSESK
ncbi:peptidase M23 [Bacterioplanes sanyensis]|uniref:Peptidase M23 n=1 Tax=Bacterioplanes sanyensis TaxID=1249553 RepID=A0A222FNM4_9GAMM|nr:peptidoglycan DD-metalloendopeptidase family protein [Bacterioplanes sanyensis]ASP39971.1 peptidase M23 [Bacterioplanes sanyensis]